MKTELDAEDLLRRLGAAIKRINELELAIADFIESRGLHGGEHVFCCSNGGRCIRCEDAYITAETKLDAVLN